MAIPSFSQPEVSGKVSWFGGPHDPSSGPTTASGASVKQPGIAVYNQATLGGYWRVTAPNGRSAVLRQTDLGPAPWTGRKVDVTYSALGQLGYNEGNFPTNSQVKATYLGKNRPSEPSVSPPNVKTAAIAGRSANGGTGPSPEQQQRAAGLRAAASLFGGNEGGNQALRQALLGAARQSQAATPQMSKLGGGPVAAPSATSGGLGSSVLGAAAAQLGTPYVWGGEQEHKGFDCSGLAQYAYKQAGITIPRTAQEQYHASTIDNKPVPGSLIFFGAGPNEVTHVEIVAANGKMIGADHAGTNVRYEALPKVGSKWGADTVLGIGTPR